VCGQSSRGVLVYRAECRGLPAVVKPLRFPPLPASAALVLQGQSGGSISGEAGADMSVVADGGDPTAAALLRQALVMHLGLAVQAEGRDGCLNTGLDETQRRRGEAGMNVGQWLEREAEAMVRVRHPRLCAVLGIWRVPEVQVLTTCVHLRVPASG
jgi:hypothetical protein